MSVHQACILVGSNIQPEKNLSRGLDLLREKVHVVCCSSTWQTPAVGSPGPDFLNLAVLITTPLEAASLKEQILRPLETQLGRVRSSDKNAPRAIDLDIIVFDDRLFDPTLWLHAHRAVPVSEIMPGLLSDEGESLSSVAAHLAAVTPIRKVPAGSFSSPAL